MASKFIYVDFEGTRVPFFTLQAVLIRSKMPNNWSVFTSSILFSLQKEPRVISTIEMDLGSRQIVIYIAYYNHLKWSYLLLLKSSARIYKATWHCRKPIVVHNAVVKQTHLMYQPTR